MLKSNKLLKIIHLRIMKTIINFIWTSAFFGKYTTPHHLVEELNPALFQEFQQVENCHIVIPTCIRDKKELKKDFHNFARDAKKSEKQASELTENV